MPRTIQVFSDLYEDELRPIHTFYYLRKSNEDIGWTIRYHHQTDTWRSTKGSWKISSRGNSITEAEAQKLMDDWLSGRLQK